MFNKNKKPNEIQPADQKPKDKAGVVANKNATTNPRDNKNSQPEKSAARPEATKN